jgi:hypothetical protein
MFLDPVRALPRGHGAEICTHRFARKRRQYHSRACVYLLFAVSPSLAARRGGNVMFNEVRSPNEHCTWSDLH